VSFGVGELDAAGFGVALGVICRTGVALGTSNRPRRCDAVDKGAADDTGVEVAEADGACVADMVADGTGVDDTDVDVAGLSTV